MGSVSAGCAAISGSVRTWREAFLRFGERPIDRWINESLYKAPGQRLATFVIWRAWKRHCEARNIDAGKPSELIAAVRAKFPEARIVRGLSGRDARPGQRHLTGMYLR